MSESGSQRLESILEHAAQRVHQHQKVLHASDRQEMWSVDLRRSLERHRDAAQELVIWARRIEEGRQVDSETAGKVERLRQNAEDLAVAFSRRIIEIDEHLVEERARAYQETQKLFGHGMREAPADEQPLVSPEPAPALSETGPLLDISGMDLGAGAARAGIDEIRGRLDALQATAETRTPAEVLSELETIERDLVHGGSGANLSAEEKADVALLQTRIDTLQRSYQNRSAQTERAARFDTILTAAMREEQTLTEEIPASRSIGRRTA